MNNFRPLPAWVPKGAVVLAFSGMALAIVLRAWVAEDAYISFRVIDNFFHGFGLRWNIHERVQAYTHPLWLLMNIALHAVWSNLFHSILAMSAICSVAAISTVLYTVRKPVLVTLACFFLPLACSQAFMDYTSSGLENPLSYLLFAVFGHITLSKRDHPRFWLYASLTAALAALNRLDSIILYAPVLVYLASSRQPALRWKQVILGMLPFMAWFAFSLFYYGFLFPNTLYAKLGTGLGAALYLEQGWHYTRYFLEMDLPSALVILSLPVLIGLLPPLERRYACAMALGVGFYGLYVVAVGGDYMAGRFWALPVFASVWLWYASVPSRIRLDIVFTGACLLFAACASSWFLRDIRQNCKACVVGQDRLIEARHTFRANALVASLVPLQLREEGRYSMGLGGEILAQQDDSPVMGIYYAGMAGYYAGPKVTLVDKLGLADSLLARLPAAPGQKFFIGHFRRDIPRGYIYALRTGSTDRMDPSLARYYEKLRLITSGDLTDRGRLKTIIEFNLGLYDHWKQDYLDRPKP